MTSLQNLRELALAATPGPWRAGPYDVLAAPGLISDDREVAACQLRPDAAFIAAASPATVLSLLDRLEQAEKEVERLTANRDHSCTCPHGDAGEPLVNHDRACPIRVNKIKRIAPEVALSRIAAALDSGDENDELHAENADLAAQLEACKAERFADANECEASRQIVNQLRADNERLRAERDDLAAILDAGQCCTARKDQP